MGFTVDYARSIPMSKDGSISVSVKGNVEMEAARPFLQPLVRRAVKGTVE